MTHLYHLFTYLFVLGVVVTLHEMGHYLACKFQGINVDTFSLGFGPTLASATLWGTLFTLRLIPLGGFIIPSGSGNRPETATEGEYFSKSWWKRLIVVYAGPAMNFVLAFFIFVGLLWVRGIPSYTNDPIIGQMEKDSLAEKAGLLPEDEIMYVNGEPVDTWREMHREIFLSGADLNLVVLRGHALKNFHIPFGVEPPRLLGILPEETYTPLSLFDAGRESLNICKFQVTQTYKILSANLWHGKKTGLAGPIGIYEAVARASSDWVETFSLMAIISLSLGIFNLLPIPLLDGGSGVLFIWEGLTGKYPSTLAVNIFQLVGLAIIGFILIFATAGDITRLLGH